MKSDILKPLIPATIILVVSSGPALAYLDPGTASIILQGIIGGGVAAASVIALYWRKFLSLFSRKKMPADTSKEDKN